MPIASGMDKGSILITESTDITFTIPAPLLRQALAASNGAPLYSSLPAIIKSVP